MRRGAWSSSAGSNQAPASGSPRVCPAAVRGRRACSRYSESSALADRAAASCGVEVGLLASELGLRLVTVEPFACNPVEVVAGVELGEDGERQRLHAPPEDVIGRRLL